jgi:hypothetical protein
LLGGCVGKAVGDLQSLHFASANHRGIYLPSAPNDDTEVGELASHPARQTTRTEQSPRSTAPSPPSVSRRVEP